MADTVDRMTELTPADLVVTRTITDTAPCPVKDCPVSVTESRELGDEALKDAGGYLRAKLVKSMEDHVRMAHPD